MRNRRGTSFIGCTLAAMALATGLAACSGQGAATPAGATPQAAAASTLDPVLAEPRVGDVYAAELTHFSGVDFTGTGNREAAFGLMRVIAVDDERLTLNTEDSGWPKARGAINELRGDQADITWDEVEKIEIYRRELPQLVADGHILEARRM
ncbi:hypothetical protein [Luteimonas sp. 3794]|uniref:hypothetical protein n=1 Tax=Luteimonas sp. 3794 TaxID=2817730 RepID=UPI0028674101|nr:hypothetical protein [Luteimonas sp. 3794]MDR6990446.1 hypothetical protein [Luteimonas sp. 3794]